MRASSITNRPRVLILNYEFPPIGGGAANATYYLLKEFGLRPDDVHATLITSSENEERIGSFAENVVIHYLDIGKNGQVHYQSQRELLVYSYKAWRRARYLHSQDPFDLIHAFLGIPCGFIAMHLDLPYIVSLRGSDVPFYNDRFYWQDTFLFKRLSRKIWKRAKHVVANSDGLRSLAQKSAKEQQITVIPNGIDLSEFREAARMADQGPLRIISTGRLIPRKGYNLLLEAVKDLQGVRVSIIGDGPEKARLTAQAEHLGVELVLHGAVLRESIPSLLADADLFVLPSLNEGMSNAALEAMAAGLPLILTDVGGSKELIHGNGWIIPKGSAEEITRYVRHLLENRSELKIMGSRSRERAKSMSWTSVAEHYLILYSETFTG